MIFDWMDERKTEPLLCNRFLHPIKAIIVKGLTWTEFWRWATMRLSPIYRLSPICRWLIDKHGRIVNFQQQKTYLCKTHMVIVFARFIRLWDENKFSIFQGVIKSSHTHTHTHTDIYIYIYIYIILVWTILFIIGHNNQHQTSWSTLFF